MITIITVDEQNQTFYARTLDATAASGDLVMPGKPTNKQIRELADNTLLAPESGTFAGFGVIWENEISTAAALLGRKGGASRSEAKVAAVRENGRKGGRPKLTDQQKMIKKNVLEHHSGVKAVRFRDGFVEVRREEGWTTHDTIHGAYSQALLDNYYEASGE